MELAREMGRIAKAPEYVTIAAGRGLNVILTETLKGSEWIGKMEVVLKLPRAVVLSYNNERGMLPFRFVRRI